MFTPLNSAWRSFKKRLSEITRKMTRNTIIEGSFAIKKQYIWYIYICIYTYSPLSKCQLTNLPNPLGKVPMMEMQLKMGWRNLQVLWKLFLGIQVPWFWDSGAYRMHPTEGWATKIAMGSTWLLHTSWITEFNWNMHLMFHCKHFHVIFCTLELAALLPLKIGRASCRERV